jgi:hypothetical protein
MTVGMGIFLASLVLGATALFSITKDRWNWPKIVGRIALGLVGLIAVGAALYSWNVMKEAREAATVKLAEQQERQARACIADDLPRMEKLARSIQAAIHDDMKLEDVKAVIDKFAGDTGQIFPPKERIKERVLIYKLASRCDSDFHLLVNVRADDQGAMRWLRIWAKSPPAGYLDGLHEELSTEFEQDRTWKALQASKAEANALAAQRSPSGKQHQIDTDPCAPNVSGDERIRRLAAFGKVRETGDKEYSAGGHRVVLFYDGSLMSCE